MSLLLLFRPFQHSHFFLSVFFFFFLSHLSYFRMYFIVTCHVSFFSSFFLENGREEEREVGFVRNNVSLFFLDLVKD